MFKQFYKGKRVLVTGHTGFRLVAFTLAVQTWREGYRCKSSSANQPQSARSYPFVFRAGDRVRHT